MIFERPIEAFSQIIAVACALFAFFLETEDCSDNDAGKMSKEKKTVTAARTDVKRPAEGTKHLAEPEGNHASIYDRIEREDDSPFSVCDFVLRRCRTD